MLDSKLTTILCLDKSEALNCVETLFYFAVPWVLIAFVCFILKPLVEEPMETPIRDTGSLIIEEANDTFDQSQVQTQVCSQSPSEVDSLCCIKLTHLYINGTSTQCF